MPTLTPFSRLIAAALLVASAGPVLAEEAVSLFTIVTVRDEIVIGLSAEYMAGLGGADTGVIARTLGADGTLTAWQYAVRKAADGELEQAPLRQVSILAHDSLRVEPYATPLRVIAMDE